MAVVFSPEAKGITDALNDLLAPRLFCTKCGAWPFFTGWLDSSQMAYVVGIRCMRSTPCNHRTINIPTSTMLLVPSHRYADLILQHGEMLAKQGGFWLSTLTVDDGDTAPERYPHQQWGRTILPSDRGFAIGSPKSSRRN